MTKLTQRLDELLKEKKARAAARKLDLGNQTAAIKEEPILEDEGASPHRLLKRLKGMTDEKVEKKIRSLSEKEMERLYIKLESDWGRRKDPENYKPSVIIRNFMIMWRGIKEEELRLAAHKEKIGEELTPLTEDQNDRIFRNTGRSRITPIASQPDRR